MFRITALVEDKYVPDILRALAGRCRGQPECTPVNIMPSQKASKGNEVTLKGETAADTIVLFVEQIKKDKHDVLNAQAMKASLQKLGWSPSSYNHYLQGALKAGLLKRGKKSGNGFLYSVK